MSIYDNNFSDIKNRKILFNNKSVNGKIKLHGKTTNHWKNNKKSYAVKLKKEEILSNYNISSFALILPDEQQFAALFSYDVSRTFGYMDVGVL